MADVSAKATHTTRPAPVRIAEKIANSITAYEGMLCGLEGGYINHWADGANDVFLGILLGGDDRANDGVLTGNTSDSPPPEARVDSSGVTLTGLTVNGTPTQAKVGDLVYCNTSNVADITLNSSGMNNPIGWMSRYTSATDQDVTLFTPSEFLAKI